MSDPQKKCPQCGTELPADAPAGLCPKCLVAAGFESESGGRTDQPKSDPEAPTIDSPSPGAGFLPPSTEELADKFPQLEILELLGHGGMGAVYKARQTNLDRLVALKIIRPEATHDPAFAERFNREAKTLARLSHQHIVAVHDFGEVGYSEAEDRPARPLYYFLMEYVDGTNLRQLMRSGELAPDQALAIVPQICDALQYAHDEEVVHRDIKPENILVDKRGRVKIADFGLAKLTTRSEAEFKLTGTHQVMGTLRYMAPEQMEGSHAVDHRADIYSLGVVFYEMLTGETPMGHFDPPSKKVEVDVRLDEVVLRSLAREPQRRYQNASDVKTDVEVISSSMPRRSAAARFAATSVHEAEIQAARERVQWPGIGIVVAGILSLVATVFVLMTIAWWGASRADARRLAPEGSVAPASLDVGDNPADENDKQGADRPSKLVNLSPYLAIVLALLVLMHPLAIIIGGVKMLRLTSRTWALAASVLTMFPLPAIPLALLGSGTGAGTCWLVSLVIGIWSLVVLNKPEVKQGFKLRNLKAPVKNDGSIRVYDSASDSQQFSRKAIVGACWVPLIAVSLIALMITRNISTPMAGPDAVAEPPWWQLPLLVAVGLLGLAGLLAPFGTTILGIVAINDIRHSQGRIMGLGLAFFDAIFFPLVVLDAAAFGVTYAVVSALNEHRNQPDAVISLVITMAICIPLDIWIARRSWRVIAGTNNN